jgi:hypothetical protein
MRLEDPSLVVFVIDIYNHVCCLSIEDPEGFWWLGEKRARSRKKCQ